MRTEKPDECSVIVRVSITHYRTLNVIQEGSGAWPGA